jgi:hypothetical protein
VATLLNNIEVGQDLRLEIHEGASLAEIQALMRRAVYENTNLTAPSMADRQLRFTLRDIDGNVGLADMTVRVTDPDAMSPGVNSRLTNNMNRFRVSDSRPSLRYRLLRSMDLNEDSFQPIGAIVAPTDVGAIDLEDTAPPDGQAFYKVEILRP